MLLASMASAAEPEEPGGERGREARPVLEIMSPDAGDCSLGLSWRWGSMAVKRVQFDDHAGGFKAVVESTDRGVCVTFDGWGEEPFIASADKQVRVVYKVGRAKEIDFTAELGRDGSVRVRPEEGQAIEARRIVIGLGKGAPRILAERAAK